MVWRPRQAEVDMQGKASQVLKCAYSLVLWTVLPVAGTQLVLIVVGVGGGGVKAAPV